MTQSLKNHKTVIRLREIKVIFTPKAYDKIWTFCPWTRLRGLAEFEAVPVMFPTKSSENTAHAKIYSIPVVLMDIVLILKLFQLCQSHKTNSLTDICWLLKSRNVNKCAHAHKHGCWSTWTWACSCEAVIWIMFRFQAFKWTAKKKKSSCKLFIGQSRMNNCCP